MPDLQRAPLTRLDVLRGLRISVWEGVWANIFGVLTGGAFQIGFAQMLGASDFVLGLMAALPAAANLLQLPASLYVERRGERRTFAAFTAAPGRWLWGLVLLLPFVLPPGERLGAFLVLLTLSSALLALCTPAWTSWMSDLVPPETRGQYFARRNIVASVATILVPLPAGAFLDQAVKYGRFDPRIGFAVLFGIGILAATVSFVLLLRQPEPPMQARPAAAAGGLRALTAPVTTDANFRRFLFYSGATVFGQTMAAQFFTAWQLDRSGLALPYLAVQILGAVAAAAGLFASPLLGLLGDKFGSRPVLTLSSVGVILPPLLWLLTLPGAHSLWWNVAVIVLLNLISGVCWTGIGLAQFNLLLDLAPPGGSGTYSAVLAALSGITGAIAPLVGGALMALLAPIALPLGGGIVLNNFKMLFLMTSILRLANLLLLSGVKEEESRSARYVLGQLASGARRPVTSFVHLRRLGRPVSEAERQQAVDALAEARSPLAVEELSRALDDVSQEVREHAARALGEVRDPRAVPALAAKLSDPAADIGELAADALGDIGDPAATTALMAAAEGPDAGVRVAAMRALARIADPNAAPVLLRALTPTHPSTCEAAAAALVAVGPRLTRTVAAEALPRLLALLGEDIDRGMRLTSARALRVMAPRLPHPQEAYEALRKHLRTERDGAVLAQEAGALVNTGQAARADAAQMVEPLLPLLHDEAVRGLARAQLLEAVAQIGLDPGAFYPYLGLTDLARDETASRLLEEIRRRASGSGKANMASPLLDTAADAYTAGDYAACLERLEEATALLRGGPPATRALLHGLATRAAEGRDVSAEEALLGVLLTRRLLGI